MFQNLHRVVIYYELYEVGIIFQSDLLTKTYRMKFCGKLGQFCIIKILNLAQVIFLTLLSFGQWHSGWTYNLRKQNLDCSLFFKSLLSCVFPGNHE